MYKITSLHGRRKSTLIHFDKLKPCVVAYVEPAEPVEAAPGIVVPLPLDEQRRYPVRDRQRTHAVYVEH